MVGPDRYKNRFARYTYKNRRKTGTGQTYAKVRKAGVRNFKKGTHPQMWRTKGSGTFAKLGAMGELGDDIVFDIHLTGAGLKFLKSNLGFGLTVTGIWRDITLEVYRPVKKAMIKEMKVKVPVDTGSLLESMETSLGSGGASRIQGFPFILVLNTKDVPYANVVNKMPDSALQHPGNHTYNYGRLGKRGGKLKDPAAKKGFYDITLFRGRLLAQKLYKNYLNKILAPRIGRAIMKKNGLKKISGRSVQNAIKQIFTTVFK